MAEAHWCCLLTSVMIKHNFSERKLKYSQPVVITLFHWGDTLSRRVFAAMRSNIKN